MFGKSKENTANTKGGKKKKRIRIGWIILVLVIVLIIFGVISARKAVSQAAAGLTTRILTEQVVREDIEEYVSITGTVLPKEKEIILSPVSAPVKEVLVSYGDLVKKGDVLVTFDMEAMEKSLYQAKLQWEKSELSFESIVTDNNEAGKKLVEANTNLKVLNQQIADSEAYLKELRKQFSDTQRDNSLGLTTRSYELQKQLANLIPGSDDYNNVSAQLSAVNFQQSILGSSDYYVQMEEKIAAEQERLAGYQEYKAKMEGQKASAEAVALNSNSKRQLNIDRELAEMAYKQAEEAYEKAAKGVVAEADGVVDQIMIMKGSTVAEGMQLMTRNSTEGFLVDATASKSMAAKIKEGQKAEITINDTKYEGKVCKVDHMAIQDARGGIMLGMQVEIENPDDSIILGWDAKVKISAGKADNVLTTALQATYTDAEGDFVFLYKGGKAVKTYVTTGLTANGRIEIKDGLNEGDVVLDDRSGIIEDGMDITSLLGK